MEWTQQELNIFYRCIHLYINMKIIACLFFTLKIIYILLYQNNKKSIFLMDILLISILKGFILKTN